MTINYLLILKNLCAKAHGLNLFPLWSKYTHLSYEDRKNIEDGLNENKSINQIALEINRSHSSILRKIERNKKYSESSTWNNYEINHSDILNFSKSSFYQYINDGIFEFGSLDFSRIIKY